SERERGAHLIAVERAMAGGIKPARRMLSPIATRIEGGVTRLGAAVAGPSRSEILVLRAAEKTPKAEAVVGERDSAVGVASARGDGIATAGDEQIANDDLRRGTVARAVAARDIDLCMGGAAVAHPQRDLFLARQGDLLRRALAVAEAPGAGRIGRRIGEDRTDPVILRCEIVLRDPIAGTGFAQVADGIHAQAADHGARPSASAGVALEPAFRGEHPVGAVSGDVPL